MLPLFESRHGKLINFSKGERGILELGAAGVMTVAMGASCLAEKSKKYWGKEGTKKRTNRGGKAAPKDFSFFLFFLCRIPFGMYRGWCLAGQHGPCIVQVCCHIQTLCLLAGELSFSALFSQLMVLKRCASSRLCGGTLAGHLQGDLTLHAAVEECKG